VEIFCETRAVLFNARRVVRSFIYNNRIQIKSYFSKFAMYNGNNLSKSNGQNEPIKNYGVTLPISIDKPTDQELQLDKYLVELLEQNDCFETEEGVELRLRVLGTLSRLFKDWVKLTARIKPEYKGSMQEHVEGKLYTYGSYRLGVNAKNADIDVLAVGPKCIERDDFFTSFLEVLQAQEYITDIVVVESTIVPIIKFVFDSVHIDLIFARINSLAVTESTNLKDNNILKNLDPRCVKSLGGCRVTDEILLCVPNIETFRTSLRSIKLWAQTRGIYSNQYGYLGGVAYAMLVCRICQLYPFASPSVILQKFFFVFSKWQWPQPVIIKEIDDAQLNFPIWNPLTSQVDKFDLMPIITPAYPQYNSTTVVFTSTRALMTKEFEKALDICNKILNLETNWSSLFLPSTFLSDYRHYLTVGICSESGDVFNKWESLVAAKLRSLAKGLERNHQSIDFCVPFTKSFKIKDPKLFFEPKEFSSNGDSISKSNSSDGQLETEIVEPKTIFTNPEDFDTAQWVICFTIAKPCVSTLDLTLCIEEFKLLIQRLKRRLDVESDKIMLMNCRHAKRSDLGQYIPDEELKKFSKPSQKSPTDKNACKQSILQENGKFDENIPKKEKIEQNIKNEISNGVTKSQNNNQNNYNNNNGNGNNGNFLPAENNVTSLV